jgi:hypothetical protein
MLSSPITVSATIHYRNRFLPTVILLCGSVEARKWKLHEHREVTTKYGEFSSEILKTMLGIHVDVEFARELSWYLGDNHLCLFIILMI